MDEKMLTVSIETEYDVLRKRTNIARYLGVYPSFYTSGLVKDLKPTNFTVLLAVASYMDAEGNCYPTQRQITEITGLSTTTVNKAIIQLIDFKVNGVPIMKREIVQRGQFKSSYYTINPLSQIAIFDGQIQEIGTSPVSDSETDQGKKLVLNNNQETITNITISEFKNSKDVAAYFQEQYREHFGANYDVKWSKDLPLIKSKWIGKFTDEQIKEMVDGTIKEYDRWKKPNFPRPTIAAMVSWIGQQALAIADDGKKEFEELKALTSGHEEESDAVLAKFGEVVLNAD